jgi:signal transduction histidine kinase
MRVSDASAIRKYLAQELDLPQADDVLVAVSGSPNPADASGSAVQPAFLGRGQGMGRGMGGMGRGMGWGRMSHDMTMAMGRPLAIAIHIDDDQWVRFVAGMPDRTPARGPWFFASLASMAVIVLAASIWAVRRVVAPLKALGAAAERFSRDVRAEPLAETGPTEMRRAAKAFNQMQKDLRRLIDNRSQLLTAVSHDLRTPLTLLRLRTEGIESGENQDRMLAIIGEMDGMIATSLDYARETGRTEPRRHTDLTALLTSIVDDLADAGFPVTIAASPVLIALVQPESLKRALTNLIDNAVKYGGGAVVAMGKGAEGIEISVEDSGPGIPETLLSHVFEPFFRVDPSRDARTGGVGLGLAIAQSIVHNHGGQIHLGNRPEGGLRVVVVLPA